MGHVAAEETSVFGVPYLFDCIHGEAAGGGGGGGAVSGCNAEKLGGGLL